MRKKGGGLQVCQSWLQGIGEEPSCKAEKFRKDPAIVLAAVQRKPEATIHPGVLQELCTKSNQMCVIGLVFFTCWKKIIYIYIYCIYLRISIQSVIHVHENDHVSILSTLSRECYSISYIHSLLYSKYLFDVSVQLYGLSSQALRHASEDCKNHGTRWEFPGQDIGTGHVNQRQTDFGPEFWDPPKCRPDIFVYCLMFDIEHFSATSHLQVKMQHETF